MKQKPNGAAPNVNGTVPKKMWAYGYLITPPQSEERLGEIQSLLDSAHTHAKDRAHTWEGRFVHEDQVTHILVVADSPDQHRDVNKKLESALNALEAGYSITAPLAVTGDDEAPLGEPPIEIA